MFFAGEVPYFLVRVSVYTNLQLWLNVPLPMMATPMAMVGFSIGILFLFRSVICICGSVYKEIKYINMSRNKLFDR